MIVYALKSVRRLYLPIVEVIMSEEEIQAGYEALLSAGKGFGFRDKEGNLHYWPAGNPRCPKQ